MTCHRDGDPIGPEGRLLGVARFVDGSILILMLTPILLPVAQRAGIDPVHVGVEFVIASTLSNFTPPVGAAIYAVGAILRCSVGKYTRASAPFMVAILAAVGVLIVLPGISLWLPRIGNSNDVSHTLARYSPCSERSTARSLARNPPSQ